MGVISYNFLILDVNTNNWYQSSKLKITSHKLTQIHNILCILYTSKKINKNTTIFYKYISFIFCRYKITDFLNWTLTFKI